MSSIDYAGVNGSLGSPRQRQSTAHIVQAWRRSSGVRKCAICHLQDGARIAAHTHEGTRWRERKFYGGSGECVIRLRFGMLLHKGREISWVVNKLFALIMDDVRRDIIQKAEIVFI